MAGCRSAYASRPPTRATATAMATLTRRCNSELIAYLANADAGSSIPHLGRAATGQPRRGAGGMDCREHVIRVMHMMHAAGRALRHARAALASESLQSGWRRGRSSQFNE